MSVLENSMPDLGFAGAGCCAMTGTHAVNIATATLALCRDDNKKFNNFNHLTVHAYLTVAPAQQSALR